MLLSWLKKYRRRKILAESFPEYWETQINIPSSPYQRLEREQQDRLKDLIQVFAAEKSWEGCGGFEMTDQAKAVISLYACLLVLGKELSLYDHVSTILVYPNEYFRERREVLMDGKFSNNDAGVLGEAWYRGPVVLSWADTLANHLNPHEGPNVVLHEFAHQLDMGEGGMVNGTPILENKAHYKEWGDLMAYEYQQLIYRMETGRAVVIDPYGAQNPAEFFAVVTESFFERPIALYQGHKSLYELLKGYYNQDPIQGFKNKKSQKYRG